MDINQVKEVLSDEAFVKKLSALESAEEIQVALREKNLEFSIEELTKLSEQFVSSGELSSEQLDDVAGGVIAPPPTILMYGIKITDTFKRILLK